MNTGSFVNLMMDKDIPRIPEVGDGCTVLMWTDRAAGTIVEVDKTGKWLTVQGDHSVRIDNNGMSDCQAYRYELDPNAPRARYTRRKNGKYYREGESMNAGMALVIGVRATYHDYSF